MAFIAARRARQASNSADAVGNQHGQASTPQHHQRSDNSSHHVADPTPTLAPRDDWSVVFPGRAATVAAAQPASQQHSDEEDRQASSGGYTLTMPPLHDGTGRFTGSAVQQRRSSSSNDDEDADDDDIYFNPTSSASLQQWDATSLASRSDSELASSLSPLPSASDSNLDDEDLISSLLLPSDSSLSRDARSDDAAGAREPAVSRAIEGSTLRRREPRGASSQAIWSWASTSAGVATDGASSLHSWSSSLADTTARPEADDDELEMDLATGQRTPGAAQRRRALQEEEEEDAFNTLLSSAPMAYSAGLGGLRNAASIAESGEAGSAARRAIKRRHRRAGGSARSKRSRSATETSASVSVARGVPRESAASRAAQPHQRSGAATPTTSEPALLEQDAARQSKSHRLLRAVLSRLLGASEGDEAVLDALLLDAGPLAVTQAEVATHTARLQQARAASRGFAHEQMDVLGSEVTANATAHAGTRTRLLIDGREVEDIEEEKEEDSESPDANNAAPDSATAPDVALPTSFIRRGAPFEPTTLEALQAALAESGLQLSNLARVPVPLRLLGELARALGVRAWTAYSSSAEATRFGKELEDDDESDDEVQHEEARVPLGQQVPSAWRGAVHPALRARSLSGVSNASID